ncbi:ATP-binding cassette domain-containing protein [Salisediminibacterium halotolerans]|uniref:ABC transport system ATP-binding protein n=1 Tax=Salisediminibacterium halotolerans TaxID=517425 RepID=A0A1H9WN08_9BACI|nr:ATP-binding cassette domain-containing protein [Salisediminibacterium haloalkalitolerans]SES34803.1 putative ABC transport system ATP-binding protein [Salisediminibacterium haloalkalitolerans]
MNVIEMENILKRYANGNDMKVLFEDMDFVVREGELVVISGEEGVGKSTVLQMIAAMTPANKGDVKVFGEDLVHIKKRTEWRLNTIGYLNDESVLMPYMSIKGNLLIGTKEDDPDYPEKEKAALAILDEIGFPENKIDHSIESLDNELLILGTIARILMTKPKIILADEPTKALEGEKGREIINHLLSFARKHNITVVFVTEDDSLVQKADRFVKIEDRQLIDETPNTV